MEPITAAVGKNGSGKTLALMERIVLPSLALGRPVLSNMVIFASPDDAHLPPQDRERHPLWRPLNSPADLVGIEGTTVVVDEIQSAFSSRESAKMPAQTVNDLLQLRKGDNILAWSAPSWMRCDTTIREVTLEVILCSGHIGKKVPGRLWKNNRLFRYRYFDAFDFEEFSLASVKSDQAGTIKPLKRAWYWRPSHRAHLMYDTYQGVEAFSHLDEYGTCTRCRGSRPRPKCSCPPREEMPAGGGDGAAGAVVGAAVPAVGDETPALSGARASGVVGVSNDAERFLGSVARENGQRPPSTLI